MSDDREQWISERAAIREFMGGQDRRNAEAGAVSDWELHCERLGLDPQTGAKADVHTSDSTGGQDAA